MPPLRAAINLPNSSPAAVSRMNANRPSTIIPNVSQFKKLAALMVEPTENESKETLDEFVEALIRIAGEAKENPELVKAAPRNMPVKRLDDVKAAKEPILRYKP